MECVPRRIMPDGGLAPTGCAVGLCAAQRCDVAQREPYLLESMQTGVCVCVSERIANSLRGSVMPKGLGGKFVSLPGKEMAALRASGRGVFSTVCRSRTSSSIWGSGWGAFTCSAIVSWQGWCQPLTRFGEQRLH
eukprot:633642-Prorocentrum_minimum.AAC.2